MTQLREHQSKSTPDGHAHYLILGYLLSKQAQVVNLKPTKQQLKKQRDDRLRYLIFFGLAIVLFLHAFCQYGILNQAIAYLIPSASAEVPVVDSGSGFVPDWSRLKFSDMIMGEGGSVTYPTDRGEETRTWSAGQSIADFMELGDFEDAEFSIEKLNLSKISEFLGIDLNSLRLSDFGVVETQTIPTLVKAIPALRSKSPASIKAIYDTYIRVGVSPGGTIGSSLNNPKLNEVELGSAIDLSKYQLTSIPGIEEASIDKFDRWQDTVIGLVPGLRDLPWSEFPSLPNPDLSFIGKVDLVLRDIEANRIRSISGSYQEGFNVPCYQNNCAHVEMSGLGTTTGAQWISGKVQQVRGGFGILQAVNDGKEPTGRHPFGTTFKQVVWDIDEAKGEMQTAMFFRFCKTIPFVGRTCTPYFIGPVPFISYREQDPIIFGNPSTVP